MHTQREVYYSSCDDTLADVLLTVVQRPSKLQVHDKCTRHSQASMLQAYVQAGRQACAPGQTACPRACKCDHSYLQPVHHVIQQPLAFAT